MEATNALSNDMEAKRSLRAKETRRRVSGGHSLYSYKENEDFSSHI
jgi:hypothetical protein